MRVVDDALRGAQAVAVSWHGVLFDRDRRAIHAAIRETFLEWSVDVRDDELSLMRGPTGRAQLERMLTIPRIAEEFRAHHAHWASALDIDAMTRSLEPRLLRAAECFNEPNADAVAAIHRLHALGIKTAAICCSPRRLLGPQLESLRRAHVELDVIITADEACEPAPAPWGIFEVMQQLGLEDPDALALIDDCPAGAAAARHAGARAIALEVAGEPASSDVLATVRSLSEIA